MILPVLFVIGLVCLGLRNKTQTAPSVSVSGYHAGGAIRVPQEPPATHRYRAMLKERISQGAPVTRWLVDNTILEAFRDGDMQTVVALSRATRKRRQAKPASEKHASEPDVEPTTPEGAEDISQPVAQSSELSELGQPSLKSPLDGVDDEAWMDFIVRMRTKNPGFQSEKYLGQYEQNRNRLKQLDLPEPKTSEEEYDTLVKDITAHAHDSAALINQWSGDVISINGEDHPVCQSGILGLLKSAGNEGAKSWLTNPSDRAKYPKTTQAFLRTNGCF